MKKITTQLLFICLIIFIGQNVHGQEIERDLNENIFIIVEVKIKAGQYDNFIETANYMSEIVESTEAGALNYEWTITSDRSTCFILERYANSEASMAHNKLFNEKFRDRFMEVVDIVGFTVYGNPSEELRKVFGQAGMESRELVSGFAR